MKLLLLFMALSAALLAQNTVSDTVNISAGVHATGYIVIIPNRAFTAAGGVVVGNTPVTANLDPSTGVFSVFLYANTTASPQPSFYTATFHLDGTPAFTQQWTIPTTPNPCNIQCASALNPAVIQLSQIDHSTAFAQYCIEYNGTAVLWTPCAGLGTLTGVIYATAGVPAAVTGSPGNCVHVDGTSNTCGGASAAFTTVSFSATPTFDGGNGTVTTFVMTLTGNVTSCKVQNFTPGQSVTLWLTQDGTGGRTFTCPSIAQVGLAMQAGKTTKQIFNATVPTTLQASTNPACIDCTPAGPVIPASSGGGSLLITAGAGGSDSQLKFQVLNFDFTASGCTSCVIFQTSAGGPFTVARSAIADLSTFSSAQFAGQLTDESGTGVVCFTISCVMTTPNLGTPSAVNLANGTALPDGGLSLTAVTTNDVSISKHGFTPTLPNDATKFLNGVGGYTVPPGTGGGSSFSIFQNWFVASAESVSSSVAGCPFFGTSAGGAPACYVADPTLMNVQAKWNGSVKNLCLSSFGSQPGGGTTTLTLMVNNAASALVATITAGGSQGFYCDITHTVSYSSGDLLRLDIINSSGGSSTILGWYGQLQ